MEIEDTRYLTYVEAVFLHIVEMRRLGEVRYGVFQPDLIESFLARPRHAAIYEQADIVRQAATLCFGLIKNHPWEGGNKRTATTLMETFLRLNSWRLVSRVDDKIELVLGIESDLYGVDEIEAWLRPRVTQSKKEK